MSRVHFYQQDIEATVNLKCVTRGSLKVPRRQFNLESGQIRLSLRVKDSAWEPRLGIEKWDAVARTLAEVKLSKVVICPKRVLLFPFKTNSCCNFTGKRPIRCY